MRFFLFVITILNLHLSLSPAQAQPERPVIVIPGILGTKLCDTAGTVIWGNRDSLWNFEQLALPFSADPAKSAFQPCGLIERIQIVGPFRVHQYDRLLDHLRAMGYQQPDELRLFPYDWRFSNFHSAELLNRFIKDSFPDPDQQVDIIAHSMGGLVARIYVQELGGHKRVRNLIMMGTPHRGSGQVFKTVEKGWSWWQNAIAGGLPAIRETLLSFPSVYQLLPSYQNCCGWRKSETAPLEGQFSAFDAQAWTNFDWLPARYKMPAGKSFITDALAEGERLSKLMQADLPPGMRHANVVTGLIDTQWKSYFDRQSGAFTGRDNFAGDGTVMEWSAANGALSEARGAQEEHQTIFDGPVARRTLGWLLGSDAEPTAGFLTAFRGSIVDAKGQVINLSSLEYEASPPILRPGAKGALTVRLTGNAALQNADLSNVRIVIGEGATATPLSATITSATSAGGQVERTVRAEFTAPDEFGVHSIGIQLQGTPRFEEYVVVTKP